MWWQICAAAAVVVVGTTSATHPHNVKALADQWQNKVRTQKPVYFIIKKNEKKIFKFSITTFFIIRGKFV